MTRVIGSYNINECRASSNQPVFLFEGNLGGSTVRFWNGFGDLRWKNRENLLIYSEQFDDANWVKSQVTITANQIVNPLDGGTTADLMVEDGTNNTHYITSTASEIITKTSYTFSVYVKPRSGYAARNVYLQFGGTPFGSNKGATFDLSQITATANDATVRAKIEDAGNGWLRCFITCLTPANATGRRLCLGRSVT
jgi:hypothetical protein